METVGEFCQGMIMNRNRIIALLFSLVTIAAIFFTVVEGISDFRAAGRQETGPFIPIISFAGLMDLFRTINFILISSLFFGIYILQDEQSKKKLLATVYLVVSFILLSSVFKVAGAWIGSALLDILILAGTLICYISALFNTGFVLLQNGKTERIFGILFITAGISLILIFIAYIFLGIQWTVILSYAGRLNFIALLITTFIWFLHKAQNDNKQTAAS